MLGHLIHIGYSKAGSTFLQEWFERHPQLYYRPGAAGGVGSVFEIGRLAAGNNLANYRYFVTSNESLCRPTLATGSLPVNIGLGSFMAYKAEPHALANSCRILKSLYPNARILFVTRGFKAILRSGFSQYVRAGGIFGFADFMQKAGADPQLPEEYDYTAILREFEQAFGPENVLTLPYELLRDDQPRFLSLIGEKLGLQPHPMPAARVNESLTARELYWYPRLSAAVAGLAKRTGGRGYRKIYRWYIGQTMHNRFKGLVGLLNRLSPMPGNMPLEVPDELVSVFREHGHTRYAAALRHNPLYQPYLADYLLD